MSMYSKSRLVPHRNPRSAVTLVGGIRGLERDILRHLKEIQAVLALMLVVSVLVSPLHQPAVAQSASSDQGMIVAWDDFEMGNRAGGEGWLDEWYGSYTNPVTHDNQPYEGTYHLQLHTYGGQCYFKRPVDLSGESNLSLQFWMKIENIGGDDYVECRVSPDADNWYPVKAWTEEQPYRFHEIDLSSHDMTSEFWIEFTLHGSGGWYNS